MPLKTENRRGRDGCKASPTIVDDGYGMLIIDCPECSLYYRVLKIRETRQAVPLGRGL